MLNKTDMKQIGLVVLGVFAGVIVTGSILDEVGQGKAGSLLQKLAQKTTRGFGV